MGKCIKCGKDTNEYSKTYFYGDMENYERVMTNPGISSKVITSKGGKVADVKENSTISRTRIFMLDKSTTLFACGNCIKENLKKHRKAKIISFSLLAIILPLRFILGGASYSVHPYLLSALTLLSIALALFFAAYIYVYSKKSIIDDTLKYNASALSVDQVAKYLKEKPTDIIIKMSDQIMDEFSEYMNKSVRR